MSSFQVITGLSTGDHMSIRHLNRLLSPHNVHLFLLQAIR